MTGQEFENLIARGETRSIEFKGAGSSGSEPGFLAVVRAVLALSNIEEGGWIVLGISERDGVYVHDGLRADDLHSWRADAVQSAIAAFCDPPPLLSFHPLTYSGVLTNDEPRTFLVIRVHEFAEQPVICVKQRRAGSIELRNATCYTRPIGERPQSRPVESFVEMRELLARATNRAVQRSFAVVRRASRDLAEDLASRIATPGPVDSGSQSLSDKTLSAFNDELDESSPEAHPIVRRIMSRGYWVARIAPVAFKPDRVRMTDLEPLLRDASVRLRAWDFPSLPRSTFGPMSPSLGRLEFQRQHGDQMESWTFCTSGQFLSYSALPLDWTEGPESSRVHWTPRYLDLGDALFRLTEFFTFAGRLASGLPGEDQMIVSFRLQSLRGRELKMVSGLRMVERPAAVSNLASFEHVRMYPRSDLIEKGRGLAVDVALGLGSHFARSLERTTLLDWQSELI